MNTLNLDIASPNSRYPDACWNPIVRSGERRDPNSIYTRVCIYEIVKVLPPARTTRVLELSRCKLNTTLVLRGRPRIIPRASIIKIPRGKKARSLARANNKLVIQTDLIARHGSRSVQMRWEEREREREKDREAVAKEYHVLVFFERVKREKEERRKKGLGTLVQGHLHVR